MLTELDQLKNEFLTNKDEMDRIRKKNEIIQDKIFELEYGIRLGATVMGTDEIEYKITSISRNMGISMKPDLIGHPRLRNGSWGSQYRKIWTNWEVPNVKRT